MSVKSLAGRQLSAVVTHGAGVFSVVTDFTLPADRDC